MQTKSICASRSKIKYILEFLQDELDECLSTDTIKCQVAILSSILDLGKAVIISAQPHVKRFFKGVALIKLVIFWRSSSTFQLASACCFPGWGREHH